MDGPQMSARARVATTLDRRGWRLGALAIVLSLASLSPAATSASRSASETATYRGQPLANQYGPLKLTVATARHGRPQGTFAIDDLWLDCEDGSLRLISPDPIRFTFTSRGQFLADRHVGPSHGGTESYLGVHGRLSADGDVVVGRVFAYENPDDGSTEAELECSTQLGVAWRAKRKG